MKTLSIFCVAAISCFLASGNLAADSIPIGDTLSIQLDPAGGAVDGVAGATVGWGFTVNWTSTSGDWIVFTGSSVGSETNPSLLADPNGYMNFIGLQGGPDPQGEAVGLSPTTGTWTEGLNILLKQGVGSYQIVSDPSVAVPGAQDSGLVTFNFDIFSGDPLTDGQYIVSPTYQTAFSVTVDASSSTPEPGSWLLLIGGLTALFCFRVPSLKPRP